MCTEYELYMRVQTLHSKVLHNIFHLLSIYSATSLGTSISGGVQQSVNFRYTVPGLMATAHSSVPAWGTESGHEQTLAETWTRGVWERGVCVCVSLCVSVFQLRSNASEMATKICLRLFPRHWGFTPGWKYIMSMLLIWP